jgi:DNA polymerase-3 subunit epsilon
MGWHRDLLVGFDLETTGTDPLTARIVTAAVTEVRDGEPVRHREWLVDPGVPIPEEATAVHGISTDRAAADGRPAVEAVAEIADALAGHWAAGVPVVVYNAPFYPRTPHASQVPRLAGRARDLLRLEPVDRALAPSCPTGVL